MKILIALTFLFAQNLFAEVSADSISLKKITQDKSMNEQESVSVAAAAVSYNRTTVIPTNDDGKSNSNSNNGVAACPGCIPDTDRNKVSNVDADRQQVCETVSCQTATAPTQQAPASGTDGNGG